MHFPDLEKSWNLKRKGQNYGILEYLYGKIMEKKFALGAHYSIIIQYAGCLLMIVVQLLYYFLRIYMTGLGNVSNIKKLLNLSLITIHFCVESIMEKT